MRRNIYIHINNLKLFDDEILIFSFIYVLINIINTSNI